MHIALLANTAWLDEELATLQHLTVGLLDDAAGVMQVIPRGRAEGEVLAFGRRLGWGESRSRRANRRSLARLADRLGGQGVTLVHALDGALWPGALDLGQAMGVPVVLGVNSTGDADAAGSLATKIDPARVAFACATAPLTDAAARRLPEETLVAHVPPGVHLGEPMTRPPDETLCVVVGGDGRHDPAVAALLGALRGVVDTLPGVQFFFDTLGRDTHVLWRAISKLGLAPHCTLTPRRLGHREVLLRAGAIVHPQPLGRARSLTLRAMAHALPVLAHDDPALDYLVPGVTARVLPQPTRLDWGNALIELGQEPDHARALGMSARAWVGEHRLASSQLDKLMHLYRSMTGETIPFAG